MLRPLAVLGLLGALTVSSFGLGQAPFALWPDGAGHDHANPAQHQGLGFGMTRVSYLDLGQTIGEVDVAHDAAGKTWVLVALLDGGFALVDGTDPASPVLASKSSGGGGYGADAKISPDSNTVYLSLQGGGQGCDFADLLPFLPRKVQCGIQVWDSANKAAPVFLGTWLTSTAGSHMADVETMNGLTFLSGAAQGSPGGNPIGIALGGKVPLTVSRLSTGFTHDITLRADPLDSSRPMAFVANWGSGVTIWDLSVPAEPVRVGTIAPPAGSGGNIHTVMPFALEGRRIVAFQSENFGQNVVSKVYFVDATDLAAPVLLGSWGNPDGKMANNGFVRWSTHNFNVADGKLYLGHYHGGVVVLDVSTLAKLANPPLLGNLLPLGTSHGCPFGCDQPYVWDAVPDAGVVWLGDINTGLHAARLD